VGFQNSVETLSEFSINNDKWDKKG